MSDEKLLTDGDITINGEVVDEIEFPFTHVGASDRFVQDHGKNLRYCPEVGWLCWDGKRWYPDDLTPVALAKRTARTLAREASMSDMERVDKIIQDLLKGGAVSAMISLARSSLKVSFKDIDADPWLFNCNNGTINLKTGELQPHRQEDLITKLSPVAYDPDAKCPLYDKFVEECQPNPEIRAYLDRFDGYCLTGVIAEHALPIQHGRGRNGKGVRGNLKMAVMGDYAIQVPTELLMEKKNDAHPTERAMLRGVRYAAATETEEDRKLNVALVKQLTGGDPISGRFMRQDFFTFWPTHKIDLKTNHKPVIRETKDAIWLRVQLVPWTVSFAGREDESLEKKLTKELPGILARMIRGCLEWQRIGLSPPEAVKAATLEFRSEMDRLGEFIEEVCVTDNINARQSSRELYSRYTKWCEERNLTAASQTGFGEQLGEKGFQAKKTGGVMVYLGIRIASTDEMRARNEAAKRSEPDPDANTPNNVITFKPPKTDGAPAEPAEDIWENGRE